MVDLPTTAVASAAGAGSSAGGGGVGGAPLQSTPANIVNLPQNLQTIDYNVTLGARLVGANSDGSVVLRTVQGDVTLQLPVSLQPGSQLQVQFQPGNPPTATLLFTAGDPLQQAATNYANNVVNNLQFPTVAQPTVATADTNAAAAQTTLQTGATVRALVLGDELAQLPTSPVTSPLGALLATPGALTNLLEKIAASGGDSAHDAQAQLLAQLGAPGRLPTQISTLSLSPKLLETLQQTVLLLQSQPGGGAGLSNNQNSLLALQLAAQNSSPAAAAQTSTAAGANTALSPSTELNLKLLQIIAPGQTVPAAAPGTTTITGQLTSQTINGQPVVQTPQGALLLQANSKLAVGSTLILEVVTDAARAVAAQTDAVKTNSAMPKLELALLTLGDQDADAMRVILAGMPKLNGMFPASALFFLQAMQTGDIRNWIGARALQGMTGGARGAGGVGEKLLEELQREFGAVGAKAQSAKPGEWRQLTIPYMGEDGLATMRLAVRNHQQEIDPEESRRRQLPPDAGRVTRFLFDVDFSEIGPLQVDGLLRPGANFQKQLDVLLRTRELLPNPVRRELMDIYSESLGAYGLNGTLAFQAGYQNWIRLNEERSANSRSKV